MAYTPNTAPDLELLTFVYKTTTEGVQVNLDVYPPDFAHKGDGEVRANVEGDRGPPIVPAVLYFHGGGLTVGNSKSWFPCWLHSQFIPPNIFVGIAPHPSCISL